MIKRCIIACITVIRPLLGPEGSCRYEQPCTDFAAMELKDKTLFFALISISKRVLLCNPLTSLIMRISRSE